MRPATFALGSRTIGEGQPCFVLAEVASAHGGEADRALKMLESAFKMGADGIKFQLFRADLLVVRRHPGRKDFDQIELKEKDWKKVLRAARASTTSRRSTPRTSTAWSSCSARRSVRPATGCRARARGPGAITARWHASP